MRIAVREQGVAVSTAGRDYARERIGHALANVHCYVQTVSVYLSDQNGPRGGEDKRCHVAVNMVVGPPLHIETRGGSITAIVDGAADKVGHRVLEAIRRNHDRRRTNKLIRALKRLKLAFGRKGDMP